MNKPTKNNTLDLCGKCKDIIDLKKAFNTLDENTTITHINLSFNELGTTSMKYISKKLKKNKTLKELSLSNNNIDNEGAQYIGEFLEINNTLELLDLDYNFIGKKGANYIANALEKNTTLTILSLWDNSLANYFVNMGDIIKGNSSIISISVLCDVSDELYICDRNRYNKKQKNITLRSLC